MVAKLSNAQQATNSYTGCLVMKTPYRTYNGSPVLYLGGQPLPDQVFPVATAPVTTLAITTVIAPMASLHA